MPASWWGVPLGAMLVAGCLQGDDASDPPPNPPIYPTDRTLEITRSGGDAGSTITLSPPGIPCSDIAYATYPDGTSVTITVAPGAGYVFVRIDWDDSTTTTDNQQRRTDQ